MLKQKFELKCYWVTYYGCHAVVTDVQNTYRTSCFGCVLYNPDFP